MPDPSLQFSLVRAAGETRWHVHESGRFIGSIAERDGGYPATRLTAGELQTQHFADHDSAVQWLALIAPRHWRGTR